MQRKIPLALRQRGELQRGDVSICRGQGGSSFLKLAPCRKFNVINTNGLKPVVLLNKNSMFLPDAMARSAGDVMKELTT